MFKIILASGSPRRKELLQQIADKLNFEFEIMVSKFDEEELKSSNLPFQEIVTKLSYNKAKEIYNMKKNFFDQLIVIGADTFVTFNNKIFGKPKDVKDAFDMLKKLQNNINQVHTGMTIFVKDYNNEFTKIEYDISNIYFKSMSNTEIIEYIKTGEPMDKAGAYAIQGIARKYIEKYDGNMNSIIGLNINKIEEIIKIILN